MMMSIDDTNLDRDNGLDFNESLITGNYHLPGGPHDDKSQNSKTLEDKKVLETVWNGQFIYFNDYDYIRNGMKIVLQLLMMKPLIMRDFLVLDEKRRLEDLF